MELKGKKRKADHEKEETENNNHHEEGGGLKKSKQEEASQPPAHIQFAKEDLPWADHKDYFEPPREFSGDSASARSLFLGGGISNCPNWQKEVTEQLLKACPSLILINPRCSQGAPADSRKQITWEHDHLRKSSAIMFWFPSATLCPIVLYELGQWTILSKTTGTKIFVGCDEKYQRKLDVEVQTELANPSIVVRDSLQAVIDDIIAWYKEEDNK